MSLRLMNQTVNITGENGEIRATVEMVFSPNTQVSISGPVENAGNMTVTQIYAALLSSVADSLQAQARSHQD